MVTIALTPPSPEEVLPLWLDMSALRAWCAWLTEEHYLEVNPAKRLKLVGRQEASKREGLSDTQANALLRQAQLSRDARRNYAIVQLLLQLYRMVFVCQPLYPSILVSQERGRCRP
jgi:hypothetical protein